MHYILQEEEFVEPEVPTEEHLMEEERQTLLDEGDFLEYKVKTHSFELIDSNKHYITHTKIVP